MRLTVAICTWNRAALLDRTLAEFRNVTVPPGLEWEIVVVNNNCTDDTDAVIARHTVALPLVRVFESKQGHCHARNAAVAVARGEFLIWTDDDVLVPTDWLVRYMDAEAKFPDAGVFGGPVRPWFGVTPPKWIADNIARFGTCWALVDHGPGVRPMTDGEYCHGANMAFRTELLRRYPFDPKYGRVGDKLTSGDDSDVVGRVRRDGYPGVWVGDAPVNHYLPAERLTAAYTYEVIRCNKLTGKSDVTGTPSTLFGAPRWAWAKYLKAAARTWVYGLGKGRRWVDAFVDRAKARGIIDRCRADRRAARA